MKIKALRLYRNLLKVSKNYNNQQKAFIKYKTKSDMKLKHPCNISSGYDYLHLLKNEKKFVEEYINNIYE